MAVKQDFVLLKEVNYFGRTIRRGTTFKLCKNTGDMYEMWENDRGILMHCPAIRLHFTILDVNEEYFVRQYA